MRICYQFRLLCIIVLCSASAVLSAQVQLPHLFSDNMVLQQQSDAPIWGTAKPNTEVKIVTSWNQKTYTTTTTTAGKWSLAVSTPVAGGPYEITISGKNTIVLKNVLIGEVWICSGQSNMQMPMNGWGKSTQILNAKEEMATANYPKIRLFQVERTMAFSPKSDIDGTWEVCTPQTVKEFSATAYFFGRSLFQDLNIPIGLIHTSWGGTLAEAWTSNEALGTMPYFKETTDSYKKIPADQKEQDAFFKQKSDDWTKEIQSKDFGYKDGKALAATLSYADDDWKTMTAPKYWDDEPGMSNFDGFVWFRKTISIPTSWAGKDLVLNLGKVDDNDFTFFNGVEVGETAGADLDRRYKIPAQLVKAGKAIIAVRILDTGGNGGFHGDKTSMSLSLSNSKKLDLAGVWKYKLASQLSELPKSFDQKNQNNPTVLFNGMLSPLIPFKIKGAIWYQGEANVDRAYQYRELFPLMINDWRKHWGYDFPFYYVQLANFMKESDQPSSSNWAELREAQLKTLHLDNTGMAVIIDAGMADNIHPGNKQAVGQRLALIARAKTYGEKVPYSGPVYRSYTMENGKIRLRFESIAGGLKAKDGSLKGFAIAGVDHKFYWADAVIDGKTIVVSSPNVPYPIAVRYAWGDNPVCNLYNDADLPASPFRTDDWAGNTFSAQ